METRGTFDLARLGQLGVVVAQSDEAVDDRAMGASSNCASTSSAGAVDVRGVCSATKGDSDSAGL